jgi:hypothetical protein
MWKYSLLYKIKVQNTTWKSEEKNSKPANNWKGIFCLNL